MPPSGGTTAVNNDVPFSRVLIVRGLLALIMATVLPNARLIAQDYARSDSIRERVQDSLRTEDQMRLLRSVQVSPHEIHFDPATKVATLTFSNVENHAKTAQVVVQFAYPTWPTGLPADTVLIATNEQDIIPRDTVIAHPDPSAHYAGRWLSGVPTSITLGPHETKRVTIHLQPPANLPDGEYWARIETRIAPPGQRGHSLDTKQQYNIPTAQHALVIRDTCRIVYRQGVLRMGLAVDTTQVVGQIDAQNIGDVDRRQPVWSHALWIRFPVHLTGNAPFHGQMHSAFRNVTTGAMVRPNTKELSLYTDAMMHWAVMTGTLSPGQWVLEIWFDNELADVPPDQRLPMAPVKFSVPFTLKPPWAY
jgi:hypothetical protein